MELHLQALALPRPEFHLRSGAWDPRGRVCPRRRGNFNGFNLHVDFFGWFFSRSGGGLMVWRTNANQLNSLTFPSGRTSVFFCFFFPGTVLRQNTRAPRQR